MTRRTSRPRRSPPPPASRRRRTDILPIAFRRRLGRAARELLTTLEAPRAPTRRAVAAALLAIGVALERGD